MGKYRKLYGTLLLGLIAIIILLTAVFSAYQYQLLH